MLKRRPMYCWLLASLLILAGTTAMAAGAPPQAPSASTEGVKRTSGEPAGAERQRISKEGIAVELAVEKVGGNTESAGGITEGDDVVLGFRIIDTASGAPIPGLRPAVWIDPQIPVMDTEKGGPSVVPCMEKIEQFLQGSLAYRPEIDLNTYFILTLNDKRYISVINPQLGFYISKLVTNIMLKRPGEDWALERSGKRLFVTMPLVGEVAVVDTMVWKVIADIPAGADPVRIKLQPDEKYLWVGNDGSGGSVEGSGVTVLDPVSLQVVARLDTGAGHHEIAFSDDNRHAFVTNRGDGSLTVIDIPTLKKVREIKTGKEPVSIAYSSLAKAVFVAHEGDGRIVALDGQSLEEIKTIQARPGLRAIRFSPDGRWGLAVNYTESVVNVVDASVNRIVHTVQVEPKPDQVSFSPAYAYIRSTASENVNAIQLGLLGKEGEKIPVVKFPTGRIFPENSVHLGIADAIVSTPEGDVVLITNPMDRTISYYMEGMLAPMGSFQNYGSEPRAVLVVDRSLRESVPGLYSTVLHVPHAGAYDVAFLLDSPRLYHCFELRAEADPALVKRAEALFKIELVSKETDLRAGESRKLIFQLTDPATGRAIADLKDLRVMYMLIPGVWHKRLWATAAGGGLYEAELIPPRPGFYQVFFECPSLGVSFAQVPHLTLNVTGTESGDGEGVPTGDGAGSNAGKAGSSEESKKD